MEMGDTVTHIEGILEEQYDQGGTFNKEGLWMCWSLTALRYQTLFGQTSEYTTLKAQATAARRRFLGT